MERPDILTVAELAEWLRVTEKTVYRMTQRGELPHVRVGRAVRYRRQDIEAYLERQVRHGMDEDAEEDRDPDGTPDAAPRRAAQDAPTPADGDPPAGATAGAPAATGSADAVAVGPVTDEEIRGWNAQQIGEWLVRSCGDRNIR
jgi:excisionase family DNA binding protein